ncbi:unnamed protein product [Owenia fusiformis]|uniref:Uncharacterized protein n=1 Tax=Owenia fusiformis TaxID=6347 RepID=A0A8J1TEF3_OWEFU|nr:unnamed protein product [Owenia fusiformis]
MDAKILAPQPSPWRGYGGLAPTMNSVEFDKQLDRISHWLEQWDHYMRCNILEGLLHRSNLNQIQFLWTVVQPALHRDFMYTAKKEFPSQTFQPVSTYTSREVKEKASRLRQLDHFHRVKSAHVQHVMQVKNAVKEPTLPDILTMQSKEKTKVKSQHSKDHGSSLPHLPGTIGPNGDATQAPITAALFLGTDTCSSWQAIKSAPPYLRFVDMPVRRHIQDQQNELPSQFSITDSQSFRNQPSVDLSQSLRYRKQKKQNLHRRSRSDSLPTNSKLPEEAWRLYHWYTDQWTDVRRNEFWTRTLLKLDPRQHYFLSSFLCVKQYRDFIALLPTHLALHILSFLSPVELVNASRVSKTWARVSDDNELWASKCDEVELEIPISGNPDWKRIFKENMYLKLNWEMGRCRILDIKGHTHNVLSVTFDKKRLASGSLDRTIKIWDIKTGACLQTLKGHNKGIWCLKFFTKNLLISGCNDGTIKVWNLRSGTCARTLLGHEGPVWAMARRGNTLVSASQDRTGKIWDISRCMLLWTLKGHNAAVFTCDISEDGALAITGSADRSIRIWEVETGKLKKVIWASTTTSIMSVSYYKGYIACTYGETICFYKTNAKKAVLLKTYKEHTKRIETVQLKMSNLSKDEGMIVSAGKDGLVKYWDTTQDASMQTFKGHHGQVNAITFDELRIASASYDNKIKVWDFNI